MRSAALALFSPRFLSFFAILVRVAVDERQSPVHFPSLSLSHPVTIHTGRTSPFDPPRPASSQPLCQPRAAHLHLHRDGSLPRDCRRLCRLRLRRPLASPCSRDRRKDRQTGGRNDARGRRMAMARRWENTSARGKRMAGGAVGSVEVARECGARTEEEEKDRPDAHLSRCQRCSRPARPRLPPLAVLARRRATAPRVTSAALL